jgi:hypothetical protein
MKLERERMARVDGEDLVCVLIGVCPPDLMPPRLLDALRFSLDHGRPYRWRRLLPVDRAHRLAAIPALQVPSPCNGTDFAQRS